MNNFTKDHCDQWIQNPLINPITKKRIKINGPTYNKIAMICEKIIKDQNLNNAMESIHISEPKASTSMTPPPIGSVSSANGNYGGKIQKNIFSFDLEVRKLMLEKVYDNFPSGFDKPVDITQSPLITSIQPKGTGSFGKVSVIYSEKLNFDFVLKQAKMKILDLKFAKYNGFPEINIMLWLNYLLYENKSMNIPLIYSYSYNDKPLKLVKGVPTKNSLNILMEAFDGTLEDIFKNCHQEEIIDNLLLQCLLSLSTMQHVFGLIHYDIKSINILYKKINPGGYWKYNFRGDEYYVKNLGYVAAISDYGLAMFSRPSYAFINTTNVKEYGRRIVEIIDNNARLINHTYCIELGEYKAPKRIGKFHPSCCFSNDLIDTEPEIPIDFENLDKFPPYEFLYDNLDLIRTFIGGKRVTQDGNHMGTKNLNKERGNVLKKLIFMFSQDNMNIRNSLKLQNISYMFSGKKLLKEIFLDKMNYSEYHKDTLLNVFNVE